MHISTPRGLPTTAITIATGILIPTPTTMRNIRGFLSPPTSIRIIKTTPKISTLARRVRPWIASGSTKGKTNYKSSISRPPSSCPALEANHLSNPLSKKLWTQSSMPFHLDKLRTPKISAIVSNFKQILRKYYFLNKNLFRLITNLLKSCNKVID